jgi:hypothetical protein
MSLTDKFLETERDNRSIGGTQRLYKFPSGFGLSLINSPRAHGYAYAWEAAVLAPNGAITYDTPLSGDVEVFSTDDEANAFIERAAAEIGGV